MKALLNWRYYILATTLMAGVIHVLVAFGDPLMGISVGVWFALVLSNLIAAVTWFLCFFALSSTWERAGKLPEITNAKNAVSDGIEDM